MQKESNAIPVANGKKRKEAATPIVRACADDGSRDLCDDHVCHFDGECRSGCCSQVLTMGYSRCTAMLVGDYCPRALDPINQMIDAQRELEVAK